MHAERTRQLTQRKPTGTASVHVCVGSWRHRERRAGAPDMRAAHLLELRDLGRLRRELRLVRGARLLELLDIGLPRIELLVRLGELVRELLLVLRQLLLLALHPARHLELALL